MTKIQVGTKLRYIHDNERYLTKGNLYEVVSSINGGFNVVDDEKDEHGWDNEAIGEYFEIVEEPMERKVLLTKVQDVALRSYLFHYGAKKTIRQALQVDSFAAPYDSLNALSYMTMVQAVDYGWGVQEELPTYSAGDIVVSYKGSIIQIDRDLGGRVYASTLLLPGLDVTTAAGTNGRILVGDVARKATPEEVMFAKVGRKLGEFRNGDLYVDIDGQKFEVGPDAGISDVLRWFVQDDFEAFYPAESRVELPKGATK